MSGPLRLTVIFAEKIFHTLIRQEYYFASAVNAAAPKDWPARRAASKVMATNKEFCDVGTFS
jgi:hypothetical protein